MRLSCRHRASEGSYKIKAKFFPFLFEKQIMECFRRTHSLLSGNFFMLLMSFCAPLWKTHRCVVGQSSNKTLFEDSIHSESNVFTASRTISSWLNILIFTARKLSNSSSQCCAPCSCPKHNSFMMRRRCILNNNLTVNCFIKTFVKCVGKVWKKDN